MRYDQIVYPGHYPDMYEATITVSLQGKELYDIRNLMDDFLNYFYSELHLGDIEDREDIKELLTTILGWMTSYYLVIHGNECIKRHLVRELQLTEEQELKLHHEMDMVECDVMEDMDECLYSELEAIAQRHGNFFINDDDIAEPIHHKIFELYLYLRGSTDYNDLFYYICEELSSQSGFYFIHAEGPIESIEDIELFRYQYVKLYGISDSGDLLAYYL